MATIQTRIARYVATHRTRYTFGSYVDATTGKIVLETDAPTSLVSSLTNLSGAPPAQRQAASHVQLHHATLTGTGTGNIDRRNDVPPFAGGAGIIVRHWYGDQMCTSGYAVHIPKRGSFMTTAGHCYNTGDKVLTESGENVVGIVSYRRLTVVNGVTQDVELIGGQSYEGFIYTGGVDSDTRIPVVGAGAAVVNWNNYCVSGPLTGEHCGHKVVAVTGEICYPNDNQKVGLNDCVNPVIVFEGGTIPQRGESGAPFYKKIKYNPDTGCYDESGCAEIRGNFVAYGSLGTGYVEPWTEVARTEGASIVTPG